MLHAAALKHSAIVANIAKTAGRKLLHGQSFHPQWLALLPKYH